MSMRNVLILSVVLVVASLLTYFFFLKNKPTTVAEIIITDEGFVPEEIKVQKGTKLIFINKGKQAHWPASNFHPTHSLYPDEGGCISSKFDACRGLKTGETFEYVIKEFGKWPLHDHLSPGLTMIVNVIGDSAEEFRGMFYADQLAIIKDMVKDDPVKTWDYVKSAFLVDGQVVQNVHEFAHIIGNAIYTKHGLEGIKYCDATFAFGCYHGVSEKLLQEKGKNAVRQVQDECIRIFPPQDSKNYTGCIHGMGHGLLSFENLDIIKALEDCDQLDKNYRSYCYDGVFMENSTETKQTFNPDEPWKFCSDLPEDYHLNCARYQSQFFFDEFNKNIRLVTASCAKASDDKLKVTCFESVGYHIAQTAKGNFEKITEECARASTVEGNNACIIGSAREVIFQRYQSWDKISNDLCNVLTDAWPKKCLDSNEQVRKTYKI